MANEVDPAVGPRATPPETSAMRQDLRRWVGPAHPLRFCVAAKKVFAFPGVQAALLLRIQTSLQERNHIHLARVISAVNLRLTGAYFGVGCRVGPGLLMPHPQGIVVGGGAVIGADCTIFHHVTLGEVNSRVRPDDIGYPKLGDRVLVGTGAVLLGAIAVDDDAVIGANAVVLADVERGDTVAGAPARSTRYARGRRLEVS